MKSVNMKKIFFFLFLITIASPAFSKNRQKTDTTSIVFEQTIDSDRISPAILDARQKGKTLKKFGYGGNININIDDVWQKYNENPHGLTPDTHSQLFMIEIKPKLGWYINEKMQVGGRIGFAFGNLEMGWDDKDNPLVGKAVGWSVTPYYSYRLIQWKRLGIWAEAHAGFGQYYNTEANKKDEKKKWGKKSEYGVQVLPLVDVYLAEGFSLQFHFGIISLGWSGSTEHFADRTEITSSWDLRKGGIDGLFRAFSNFGIGLARRF